MAWRRIRCVSGIAQARARSLPSETLDGCNEATPTSAFRRDDPMLRIFLIHAAVAGFVLLARLYHDTWWGKELFRFYGVRPSGPFASYTRRDHVLRAGASLLVAVLLILLCIPVFMYGDAQPLNSRAQQIAMAYAFVMLILAAMAVAISLSAIWASLFARQLPDQEYAVFISGVLAGFSNLEQVSPCTFRGLVTPWRTRAARKVLDSIRANPDAVSPDEVQLLSRDLALLPLANLSIVKAEALTQLKLHVRLPLAAELNSAPRDTV